MTKLFMISFLLFSSNVYANWFNHLIDLAKDSNMIQRDILSSQRDIESMMKELNRHTSGNSGWGNYGFRDYQSYGQGARNWNLVLQMTENGGSGALGQNMSGIAREYPTDKNTFNRGIKDPTSQQYYRLKAQTIVATRAASQLDYDKIQDQIEYQQMLQQQIEQTRDLKGAMDLSNRINVEGNLINLEILRQVSLLSQQQAINEQGSVNSALSHAKFLIKH